MQWPPPQKLLDDLDAVVEQISRNEHAIRSRLAQQSLPTEYSRRLAIERALLELDRRGWEIREKS